MTISSCGLPLIPAELMEKYQREMEIAVMPLPDESDNDIDL
jgi:hypothetical protein